MDILEFRREPVVYSRVMAWKALQNSCLISDVKTPVYCQGTPRDSP